MRSSSKLLMSSALFFLVLVEAKFVSSAAAQGAAGSNQGGAAEEATGGNQGGAIGEIVVTAQRRSEQQVHVPVAVTALNAIALKTNNIEEVSQLADIVPGLQFQSNTGFVVAEMRGIGALVGGNATGANVGIYVDGFYIPNQHTEDTEFVNVLGVQVLKGPQGTLFGRNTSGGAILITTTEPSLTPALEAEIAYESYDTFKVKAYADMPVGDNVALDIGIRYRYGDDWIKNIVDGQRPNANELSIRVGAKFFINDDITALLRVEHTHANDPDTGLHSDLCCNAAGKPYAADAFFGVFGLPQPIIATTPGKAAANLPPEYKTDTTAVQSTVKADLGWADLTSYTQFRYEQAPASFDLVNSSANYFDIVDAYVDRVWTQEFLLNSKPGRLQWTAGYFYFYNQEGDDTLALVGSPPSLVGYNYGRATAWSMAGYGNADYRVTEQLIISAGLRYGLDKYYDAFTVPRELAAPMYLAAFGTAATHFFAPVSNWKALPRAVIRYEPTEHSSVYASFTKGFKAGFDNVGSTQVAPVAPENIFAYEIGYKYAGHSLSFNVDAYFDQYKDLQENNYVGNPPIVVTSNAATARIQGLEGDFRYAVDDHLSVSGATGYTLAQFVEYNGAPAYMQCTVPATCGASLGSITSFPKDLHHSQMPYAPRWNANIGARYTTGFLGGDLDLTGNLSYTTKEYFDPVDQFSNKAHENLALRVQWTDPSGHYTVAAYGDNLTNDRHLTLVSPQSLSINTTYNHPLILGISFGYSM